MENIKITIIREGQKGPHGNIRVDATVGGNSIWDSSQGCCHPSVAMAAAVGRAAGRRGVTPSDMGAHWGVTGCTHVGDHIMCTSVSAAEHAVESIKTWIANAIQRAMIKKEEEKNSSPIEIISRVSIDIGAINAS